MHYGISKVARQIHCFIRKSNSPWQIVIFQSKIAFPPVKTLFNSTPLPTQRPQPVWPISLTASMGVPVRNPWKSVTLPRHTGCIQWKEAEGIIIIRIIIMIGCGGDEEEEEENGRKWNFWMNEVKEWAEWNGEQQAKVIGILKASGGFRRLLGGFWRLLKVLRGFWRLLKAPEDLWWF